MGGALTSLESIRACGGAGRCGAGSPHRFQRRFVCFNPFLPRLRIGGRRLPVCCVLRSESLPDVPRSFPGTAALGFSSGSAGCGVTPCCPPAPHRPPGGGGRCNAKTFGLKVTWSSLSAMSGSLYSHVVLAIAVQLYLLSSAARKHYLHSKKARHVDEITAVCAERLRSPVKGRWRWR